MSGILHAWPPVLRHEAAFEAGMVAPLQAQPHSTSLAVTSLSWQGAGDSYCSLADSAQLVLDHNIC